MKQVRATPATVERLETLDGLNAAPKWMQTGMSVTVDLDSTQYQSWPTDKPGVNKDRTLIFVIQAPNDIAAVWTLTDFLNVSR